MNFISLIILDYIPNSTEKNGFSSTIEVFGSGCFASLVHIAKKSHRLLFMPSPRIRVVIPSLRITQTKNTKNLCEH